MSYCSFNYELLGKIVARVSGRPLAECAQDRVFGPLGMHDTFYVVPGGATAVGCAATCRRGQEVPYAGGGVFGTARDLAAFGQMFLNRGRYGDARVLSPTTVLEMTRDQIPRISASYGAEFFPDARWGLGWDAQGRMKAVRDASLRSAQTQTLPSAMPRRQRWLICRGEPSPRCGDGKEVG
jgi:YD repeat-containing protein